MLVDQLRVIAHLHRLPQRGWGLFRGVLHPTPYLVSVVVLDWRGPALLLTEEVIVVQLRWASCEVAAMAYRLLNLTPIGLEH